MDEDTEAPKATGGGANIELPLFFFLRRSFLSRGGVVVVVVVVVERF